MELQTYNVRLICLSAQLLKKQRRAVLIAGVMQASSYQTP